MQSVWQLNHSKNLLLFFSGWGMDERPTAHLTAGDYDVCTCFNYNDLATGEAERWKTYDAVTVVAWSMGVWAAERVLADPDLPVTLAIAIDGTPKPMDDSLGIPSALARGTLDGLTPESLQRFYRRMLGSGNLLKHMEENGQMPVIDLDERKEELRRIVDAAPYPDTSFEWSKAIISLHDAIFPTANQANYWRGTGSEVRFLDAPHYPFRLFKSWEELIGE